MLNLRLLISICALSLPLPSGVAGSHASMDLASGASLLP
jgi:hypothetical protein